MLTKLMPFTAFDESGMVGFFTLRNPGDSLDELRFGFVIVDPRQTRKRVWQGDAPDGLKICI